MDCHHSPEWWQSTATITVFSVTGTPPSTSSTAQIKTSDPASQDTSWINFSGKNNSGKALGLSNNTANIIATLLQQANPHKHHGTFDADNN